jgi:hypothetical protein
MELDAPLRHRDSESRPRFLDSLRSLGMTRGLHSLGMTAVVIPSAVEESAVLRASA